MELSGGRMSKRPRIEASRGPTSSPSLQITQLDDACMLHIFEFLDPLPDRFHAARTCKRFHRLATSPCTWLIVTSPGAHPGGGGGAAAAATSLSNPPNNDVAELITPSNVREPHGRYNRTPVSNTTQDDAILTTTTTPQQVKEKEKAKEKQTLAAHQTLALTTITHSQRCFATLAEAVSHSRPGDTVVVRPSSLRSDGARPHRATGVVISHPLRIVGGQISQDSRSYNHLDGYVTGGPTKAGQSRTYHREEPDRQHIDTTSKAARCPYDDALEKTRECAHSPHHYYRRPTSSSYMPIIACESPRVAALIFAATGKMQGLRVFGGSGGSVLHLRGKLEIEDCALSCDPAGLPHLFSPIITFAGDPRCGDDEAHDDGWKHNRGRKLGCVSETRFERHAIHDNGCSGNRFLEEEICHLSVASTTLEGGCRAVRVLGGGQVASVRAIYESRRTLLWFEVTKDSKHSDLQQQQQQQQQQQPASMFGDDDVYWKERKHAGLDDRATNRIAAEGVVETVPASCSRRRGCGSTVDIPGSTSRAITCTMPSWMRSSEAGSRPFDPLKLQRAVQQAASSYNYRKSNLDNPQQLRQRGDGDDDVLDGAAAAAYAANGAKERADEFETRRAVDLRANRKCDVHGQQDQSDSEDTLQKKAEAWRLRATHRI